MEGPVSRPRAVENGRTGIDLEAEVRRLAPWYYRWDLDGVRTDAGPPADHHGHRTVSLPAAAPLWLRDRTVLDVGCNEGGYASAALDAGAESLLGIDCRAVNIEKARLVARVKGRANVRFEVADAGRWLREHPGETFDYVFLCGLLYHLPRPWETIAGYCRVAREGIFLTCVLAGGEDGYTPFPEIETIGASLDPSELSMMPNTTRTLVKEFEKHRFYPAFVGENRTTEFWGGCSLLLRNCTAVGDERRPLRRRGTEDEIALHVLPARAREWSAVAYNWSERAIEAEGVLDVLGTDGAPLARIGPAPVRLAPRVGRAGALPSLSATFPFELPRGAGCIEAELRERTTGHPLARSEVDWSQA